MKKHLSLILSMLLVLSFTITAHATYRQRAATLSYNDIRITLNGTEIIPKDVNGNSVEPFVIDGTTYLPVRGIASSLGISVGWDGNSRTVTLTSDTSKNDFSVYIRLLGYYKIMEENYSELKDVFNNILQGTYFDNISGVDNGKSILKEGPYVGKTIYQASRESISSNLELAEGHYSDCLSYLSDDDVVQMVEYRRLANLAMNQLNTLNNSSNHNFPAIIGAALQNWGDCLFSENRYNTSFWNAYQAALKE